jgi:hypothetical protein
VAAAVGGRARRTPFDAEHFDPRRWTTIFPAAPFERATARDELWGARLVADLDDESLAVVVAAADWPDPAAADILERILRERRRKIAEACFDVRRINPIDRVAVDGAELTFRDLSVAAGSVDPASALYRLRAGDGGPVVSPRPRLPIARPGGSTSVEIDTSHDHGASWSPPLRVRLEGARVAALERVTR